MRPQSQARSARSAAFHYFEVHPMRLGMVMARLVALVKSR